MKTKRRLLLFFQPEGKFAMNLKKEPIVLIVAVLIGMDRRSVLTIRQGGLWHFPELTRKPGESDAACLIRMQKEVFVEYPVSIGEDNFLGEWAPGGNATNIVLRVYQAYVDGIPKNRHGVLFQREYNPLRCAHLASGSEAIVMHCVEKGMLLVPQCNQRVQRRRENGSRLLQPLALLAAPA